MKVGDLVLWDENYCNPGVPGLVLETKPAKKVLTDEVSFSPVGLAVLAMMPGLPEPEWFHERELEFVSESR